MGPDRAVLVAVGELVAVAEGTHFGARNEPRNGETAKTSWRISWKSRRISHWAIVHSRRPDMWMSARRFVVITRFVRVAFGEDEPRVLAGDAGLDQLAVQPERAVDLLLVALAQVRVALGDRVRAASSPRP